MRKEVSDPTKSLILPHLPDTHSMQYRNWSSSQSLLWPRASQRQRALRASFAKRPVTDSILDEKGGGSNTLYSLARQCNGVNGLVEPKGLLSTAGSRRGRFPRSAHTLTHLQPPPPLLHPTPPAGMGLSPQLMKYISDAWKKHVQDLP